MGAGSDSDLNDTIVRAYSSGLQHIPFSILLAGSPSPSNVGQGSISTFSAADLCPA